MDPLGFAATVITVIQATNTIISICYDYSAAAKNCPWELSRVIDEVKSLRNVLESLAHITSKAENADLAFKNELPVLKLLCEPEGGPLKSCLVELESLEKKLTPPGWSGQVGSKRRALVQALGWPLKEQDTKKTLENITRFKNTLQLAIAADQVTLTLGVKEGVTELNESMKSKRLDDQREKIHQWLAAPNPSLNHNEARKKRQATTGAWFMGSTQFSEWKKAPESFLWLHGIPGCGKTILASSIIECLLQSCHLDRSLAVVYFYFDFNDIERQLHEKMIRSLITQLSIQCASTPRALELFLSSCMDGERQPTVDGLLEILRHMIEEFDETFVVLDALDECIERQELLEDIEKITAWKNQNLHIIVTSRQEKDIEERIELFVKNQERISIQNALVDDDIRAYIRERLQTDWRLKRWQKRPEVQQEIERTLMDKADGMFRWAVCQLDVLGNCLNLPMLRKALASLPKTLDDTYARILCGIDEEHSENTLKILQWLSYSARPLQIEEITEVITVDIKDCPRFDSERRLADPRDILTMCSSLITMTINATEEDSHATKTGEQVRLAHFSVKEYLVSERIQAGPATRYGIQEIQSNVSMAEICLAYLLQFESPSSLAPQTFEEFPLIRYAAQYWPQHARWASKDASAVHQLTVELFLSKINAYVNWIRLFNPDKPWRKPEITKSLKTSLESVATPLYYASLTGLDEAVTILLGGQADVNAQGGEYGNSLQAASFGGNDIIVQRLIDAGADINAQGGLYGSALQAASCMGHDRVVQLLLGAAADVNAQGGKYGNALYAASDKGHDRIVQRLLNAGAEIDARGGVYGNALQVASFNGHDRVVQQLIDAGATVSALGGVYGNALQAASCNDDERIVQHLLDAGADPNAHGGVYGNALQAASFNGRDKVAQQLLDAKADVNAQGGFYGNALQAASFNGRELVIERLLEVGADVNTQGGWYGNALYAAAFNGHYRVVEQLLDAGADVDAQGGLYGTALQAASFGGHYQIGQRLLDAGANVNAQGGLYGYALQAASFNGHDRIVKLLLNAAGNVNAHGGKYGSALQAASNEGHYEVVKHLIHAGADLDAQGGVRGNALQAALTGGHDQLVQLLLEAGAEFNAQEGKYENALQAASDKNNDQILQLQLSKDFDASRKDKDGRTTLQRAAYSGQETVVRLLVDHYKTHNIAIPDEDVKLYSHIFCDDCGSRVPNWDAHYHCVICLDDDFDLCYNCVEKGIHCRGDAHKLTKRRIMNGKIIDITGKDHRDH